METCKLARSVSGSKRDKEAKNHCKPRTIKIRMITLIPITSFARKIITTQKIVDLDANLAKFLIIQRKITKIRITK